MSETYRTVGGVILLTISAAWAQDARVNAPAGTRWVTVTEMAAGTDGRAKDQAVATALRKAVEQGTGVFLASQSRASNYQLVYDKIFAEAVGYVVEHQVLRTWVHHGITYANVKALVSTQRFQQDWGRIMHTVHQAGNPRVIVVIGETTIKMLNTVAQDFQYSGEETGDVTSTMDQARWATNDENAQRWGAAGVVQGRFNWFGVRRPRWFQEQRDWEQMQVSERESAFERYRARVVRVARQRGAQRQRVWKRVAETLEQRGTVQGRIEEFFVEKGINLVDRGTAQGVNKRDLALATGEGDMNKVAVLGAKYNADVVILGTAAVDKPNEIPVGNTRLYKYPAKLVVRAVRTDTGKLLVAKVFTADPTSTQASGGADKALDTLGKDAAPKVLAAVIEAWRKQANVRRNIELEVDGMDFAAWKKFQEHIGKLRGMKALRRRSIIKDVAEISAEYDFDTETLADHLIKLTDPKLKVTEITATKIKLKVVGPVAP